MSKKGKQFEKEPQVVDCQACDGFISIEFFMGRGDVLYCGECGTEYVLKSRKPFRLVRLEEEEEYNDYYEDEGDDDYGAMLDYGDDSYGDGRDYE